MNRRWRFDTATGLRLEASRLAPIAHGWLRCRVLRVQPSVTELMLVRAAVTPNGAEGSAHDLGHEFVALVTACGDGVDPSWSGQRIVCPPRGPCGCCRRCGAGEPWACERPFRLGVDAAGAMAEFVDLPAAHVLRLPATVSDLNACCSQPAASAVANLVHVGMRPQERVLILGQGTMGLLLLQAALTLGAASVVTTAPRESTRTISRRLGAHASLAPDDPELERYLADLNPTLVIDAAGGARQVGLAANDTLSQALEHVAPYGTVLAISDMVTAVELPPAVRQRAVRLVFGQMGYYYGTYGFTLGLLGDGRIDCGPLVTHELEGIERLPEAFDLMADRARSQAVQVQIVLATAASRHGSEATDQPPSRHG